MPSPVLSEFSRQRDASRVRRRLGAGHETRVALGATLAAALFLLAGMAGCSNGPFPSRSTGETGGGIGINEAGLARAPARDRALWEDRVAADELRRDDFAKAGKALDAVIASLGGQLSDPAEAARQTRLYLASNATTDFVGEPYERVMTYYYRGIVYWREGNPAMARTCFHSAALVDSDPLTHQYASDYVLPDYLEGLATTLMGGDASADLTRAQANTKLPLPPYDPYANVLCFVEYGRGPLKYATGLHQEQLRFETTPSQTHSAVLVVAGQKVTLPPYDDLDYQATTRGGRIMDYVVDDKGVFGSNPKKPGTAPLHPADTRAWDNLPQYLSFAAIRLPPGTHAARLQFYDAKGRLLPEFSRDLTIQVAGSGKETVVFLSELSNS